MHGCPHVSTLVIFDTVWQEMVEALPDLEALIKGRARGGEQRNGPHVEELVATSIGKSITRRLRAFDRATVKDQGAAEDG